MTVNNKSYAEICLERAEKATEGPWTPHNEHGALYVSNGKDGRFAKFDNRICEASTNFYGIDKNANMGFIAHARTDVPELARRLQKAVEGLRQIELQSYEGENKKDVLFILRTQLVYLADELERVPEGKK